MASEILHCNRNDVRVRCIAMVDAVYLLMSAFNPLRTSRAALGWGVMHAGYALLPTFLFLLGCSVERPKEELVTWIEHRLSPDRCLKNIHGLRRTYQFAKRGQTIDSNRVYIDIQEAGHNGLPAGRFSIQPEKNPMLDDRQFFGAHATYVVSTDELDIWACGMNFGGIRHAPRL